jgi:hypothetical protein
MSLSELCTNYISSTKLKDETERNIIEFAEAPWGLGLGTVPGMPPLFPLQKFIFKTYYNIPLSDDTRNIIIMDKFNEKERYRFNELEYLNFLFNEGRINVKEITGDPEDTRPNLVLVIGRRGLKTSSIAVLVAFETYKLLKKVSPQEYYRIMPDDEIRVSCVATNQEQASELFRRIGGHLERSEYFKKYREKPTLTYMKLSTQRDIESYGFGNRSSLRIVASPCTGRGLRSHNNIIAVLDEMAHFFEAETAGDKSDRAIYEAITPSIAKFNSPEGELHGRVICISSPNDRSGKFFELYQRSMESDCEDLLMIQAPTWEVDYTLSSKYLRSKYTENPVSYMSEFGAEFSDRVTAWIENEQMLRINIIPGLKMKKMSYERTPHFMGIDVGLKNDGTAIAICHVVKEEIDGLQRDLIELDTIDVRYAKDEDKEYFHPEEIAEWIASYSDKFFIVKGIMDQYYGMAIVPMLHEKGFKQIQAVHVSRDFSSKVYQNLMSRMLDASLRIPEGEDHLVDGKKTKELDLITEMLRLRAISHSKYLITVKAPDVKDMHDDLSDAYSRAIYLASEYMASGGGIVKNNRIENVGAGGISYKQYYMKQKRGVLHTKRPSSALQMEISRNRTYNSLGMGSINALNRGSRR